MATTSEAVDVASAKAGDREAFDRLARPHVAALRTFLYRFVAQPDDAADLAQDTLVTAYEKLDAFREDAKFRTWLFSIAVRKALDLLRARKRWDVDAQTRGEQATLASAPWMAELQAILARPDHRYEYRQHVAYCLSCVARTLPPEESAALLLKEVAQLEGREAARAMELSESTFRHRLTAARNTMEGQFEGLCGLVGKRGVCWQCDKLREIHPEDRRGAPVEAIAPDEAPSDDKLRRRLAIVRSVPLDVGASPIHDLLFRIMASLWDGEAMPSSP